MTGFLPDTNVPSELTRPKPEPRVEKWLDDADDELLFLSVVSLGEAFKGLAILPENKRRHELAQGIDQTLRPWFEGRILPVTEPIAKRWGLLAGACQIQGRPLKVADGLIAATALGARFDDCHFATCGISRTSVSLSIIPGPPDAGARIISTQFTATFS